MQNICQSAAYGDGFGEDACSFPSKMGIVFKIVPSGCQQLLEGNCPDRENVC
jgi:hypothetical protein